MSRAPRSVVQAVPPALAATPATPGAPPHPAARDIEALVQQHQQQVAGLASRLLGWNTEVEDVVQDVFVNARRAWPTFRREAEVTTWLYRITVNACRRHRRRQMLRLRTWSRVLPPKDPDTRPEVAAAQHETHTRVRNAVAALPRRDREVVVLRCLEELSAAAVAEILGISTGAVDTRLSRARQRLRGQLSDLMEGSQP